MYKNEALFSSALVKFLRTKTPCVQRIESGLTGRGIPDLYVRMPDRELWIELKNHNWSSIHDNQWRIKWRKGQQGWAYYYRKACNLWTHTFVAVKDGFIWIPMKKRYVNNIVMSDECYQMTALSDIMECIRRKL